MAEDLITGLDIGSATCRVVVAQRVPALGGKETLQVIGAAEVPSEGISKGIINSIDDAVSSVSMAIERAERMVGAEISSAWVAISGSHILSQTSRGVVGVSRPDGEIREEDVARAIEASQTVATPPNYEILHVLPKSFTVDGQSGIKDPVGMNGIRLEVEAEIIQGLSSQVKNLTKCVYRTGVDIEDLVFGILATAEAVTTPRMRELGVGVANIGGSTTSLIVFEGGDVLHTAVLPIGSEHITSDIAIGLRISIEAAEEIKVRYGTAQPKDINRKEAVQLSEVGVAEEVVSKKYIAEIIEARVEEIFEKVDHELKKVGRSGLLPAGMVLTGGGAKLPGAIEVAKAKLRLPATLGLPLGVTSITDRINDPSFTTAVGLVHWGALATKMSKHGKGRGRAMLAKIGSLRETVKKTKSWLQNLLP
jgi:cell division protein FtsA